MASKETVARMMVLFGETWKREIANGLMDIYHAALEDLSDGELIASAWGCVEECRFFPTPAEILGRCGKQLGVEEAWAMVMGAVQTSDLPPAVRATVKNMGGLKLIREGDFRWAYRDFRRAYPEIADRVRTAERLNDVKLLPMMKKLVTRLEGHRRPALIDGKQGGEDE